MNISKDCPDCDKSFDNTKGLRTHHGIVHDSELPNNTCSDCGTRFYCEWNASRKYCDECFSFEGEKNPMYENKKIKTTCDNCKATFEYYESAKDGVYCNDCQKGRPWVTENTIPDKQPSHYGNVETKVCDNKSCRNKITRYKSNFGDNNFCCATCKNSWISKKYEGRGHPNWEESYPTNYGEGWYRAKRDCLNRDNSSCRNCGISKDELGQNPDVHHIKPVKSFDNPPDAHFLDNLVCLCRSCHNKLEGKDLSTWSTLD